MSMKNKIKEKLTQRLAFSFGILFAFLMAVIPVAAGIYSYIEHSSEYRRGLSEKLSQVSAVLVPEVEIAVNNDDIGGWKLRAVPFMNAFELASISLFEVSPDNSRVLLLADVRPDKSEPERYPEETAGYFRDASPEVSEVLNEVTEKGSAVSVSDIFNGEYGKVITCYTAVGLSGGRSGVMCAAAYMNGTEQRAIFRTLIFAVILEAVIAGICALGMRYVSVNCIDRIRYLTTSIEEYTRIKDPVIAENIRRHTRGNDEIAVLSLHTASMITEIQEHIDRIMQISGDLLTANERAEKFSELARKDALTGLENKLSYYENVKRLDEMIKNGKANFAVIVIDLNYLKRINDECGHNEGDAVLKKLADKITGFFGSKMAFRIGGDEFAVIVEGEESRNALTLAANFRNMVSAGYKSGHLRNEPSAAVGCSNYRAGQDKSVRDVFERADNEMYGNKIQMKAVRRD